MASVTVDVEVELSDFDLDEIIEEIKFRYKIGGSDVRLEIQSKFKLIGIDTVFNTISISDKMKIDFFIENISKISLTDLEKLI